MITNFALTHLSVKYVLPGKIFNVDETGISTVSDSEIILAEKGQKRIGTVSSGERGQLVTVICSMSASGNFVPPFFIFPRRRMAPLLMKDGPSDAAYHISKNEWSNEELFVVWLKHFTKFVKPSKEEPVLLILVNHGSHVTYDAFMWCKENGIVMLSIPPHTSHRLQPLDVTFYGPLKTVFKAKCNLFIKSNVLRKITNYDLAILFNMAYSEVATIKKGVSRFSTTGIFPMNPGVFNDEDYLLAETLQDKANDHNEDEPEPSCSSNARRNKSSQLDDI
jgi:hypothetical protein